MEIDKILERVGRVKLQGGIFGKVTWAVIIICLCVTVLAFATKDIYVMSATIAAMMLFGFYFFNKLLNFAEKNPKAAILDGAKFVMHEQIVQAAKGRGKLPKQSSVIDHNQPEFDPASIEADDVESLNSVAAK